MVFKDDYPIPVVHSEKETKKPERTLCRRQFFFSFFFFVRGYVTCYIATALVLDSSTRSVSWGEARRHQASLSLRSFFALPNAWKRLRWP